MAAVRPPLTNKGIIFELLQSDLSDLQVLQDLLAMAIEVEEEDKSLSRKVALKVRFRALDECETGDIRFYNLYNNALLYLAQAHMDFDAYLLYVEKDRDPEDRIGIISHAGARYTGLLRKCSGYLTMSLIFCQSVCHQERAKPL